ncbi:MAG: hypothetical protein ACLS3S_00495 [Streptococcus salivarius]
MTHYQELPQALMKEKHQGQTLTKEEVKVQTAMILVWKMFQRRG